MNKTKILILSANPKDTARLRLDEEVREISEGLKRSKKRDQFIIEQRWAVRPRDLRHAFLDVNPKIVHFSGHGSSKDGLLLENDDGNFQIVEPKALAGLFELFRDKIECVLLNACYSNNQAQSILQHVNYVIGMNDAIEDKAAIEFSVGFYDAIGSGKPFDLAYKFGCNALQLAGFRSNNTVILNKNDNLQSTIIEQDNREPCRKLILVLSATIDEMDKEKAEAIIDHLRQISGDCSLTLKEILSGSVKLIVECSDEAARKLESLFRNGEINKISGTSVLSHAWLPKEILEMDEFLPDELKKLRDYVLIERGEDISIDLHVFEERVLFSSLFNDKKLHWSTISTYEQEILSDGTFNVRSYKADIRTIKRHFLRGWLEVQLWDRGLNRKQIIYEPPEKSEDVGLISSIKDYFFLNETAAFSLSCMKNFYYKYFTLQPFERHSRPRFMLSELSDSDENEWTVFVDQKLFDFYYDSKNIPGLELNTPHNNNYTKVINFNRRTEAFHAALANFITWQEYLHEFFTSENDSGNIKTKSIIGNIYNLDDESDKNMLR